MNRDFPKIAKLELKKSLGIYNRVIEIYHKIISNHKALKKDQGSHEWKEIIESSFSICK